MIDGLAHVGISVANLERSLRFYRDLLGMRVIVQKPFSGERYEAILGLSAAKGTLAVLSGPNIELELFEFTHPQPRPSMANRPVCDHGITHFCLKVGSIAETYERLKAAGVSFHSPPIRFSSAESATYGRDPDGNVFELLELRTASKAE